MFVEVADYPAKSVELVVLVTTKGSSLFAGVYTSGRGELEGAVPATDALALIAQGKAPDLVRHLDASFIKQSVAVHGPDVAVGFDELVDYSVLDLYMDSNVWEPRLSQTKQTKLIYSSRVRDLQRRRLLASLYVRFATGDLSETVVHLVDRGGCLVTDLKVDDRFDGTAFPVGKGGALWLRHFWHADIQEVGRSANGIEFAVELKNNRDDSQCHRSTKLEISSDAGYLPRRTLTTDEAGKGRFTLIPMGLDAGESVKVKLSATHFTNIGSATTEV